MSMLEIQALADNVKRASKNLALARQRVKECEERLEQAIDAAHAADRALAEASRELLNHAKGERDPFEAMKRTRT